MCFYGCPQELTYSLPVGPFEDDSLFFQGGICDPSLGQVPNKNSVLDGGNFNLKYAKLEIFRQVFLVVRKRCCFFWCCIHTFACKMSTPSKVPNYGNYGEVLVMK